MSTKEFEPHPLMEDVIVEDKKYYMSSFPSMKMHRPDAGEIIFVNNFFETNNQTDQDYLDREISKRNPNIRAATDEEVKIAHMRIDPRGTITKELLEGEIDSELEAALEARILAKHGLGLSDEGKIQGIDGGFKAEGNADVTVKQELTALQMLEIRKNNQLTPVSTADINKGAAGSTSL